MFSIYDQPGHLIRRLHQISTSIFADRMARNEADLTAVQFAAMSVLRDNAGIDQATLAGLIAFDRVTIGGVLDRLEAKGLVARAVSPHDRRARVLHLTKAGAALVERLTPVVQDLQGDVLVGLTEAERSDLLRLMTKATAAANELSRAPLHLPSDK